MLGQYGDPWDLTLGLNWFPFLRKEMRVNAEGIYLRNSPVGGISYPYVVGGNGWLFNTGFHRHVLNRGCSLSNSRPNRSCLSVDVDHVN